MPPIWKPQSHDTLKYWVETILEEASDNLNDWETNFMENISVRVMNKIPLTQIQEEKLEQIYAKHTK